MCTGHLDEGSPAHLHVLTDVLTYVHMLLQCMYHSMLIRCFCVAHNMVYADEILPTCRYAGAGLFESVQSTEPQQSIVDYSTDRLLIDNEYQHSMLGAIGLVSLRIEQLLGGAQDIEGVIDDDSTVHIVQTRPQV